MAKVKTAFFCSNCGYESPKWLGKCPSCNEWNTFLEETLSAKGKGFKKVKQSRNSVPLKITEITENKVPRRLTGDTELDRVLGGGIVQGSVILLGGEPGVGKSTLMLQVSVRRQEGTVLYVSGEESMEQVRQRAERIGMEGNDCYVLGSVDPEEIIAEAEKLKPSFLVIDSVQTLQADWLESAPGSVSQVRESTATLLKFAKESGTPLFLIGHITKEGSLAGPKVLEHMVDTVILFEGDSQNLFRMIRSTKNRFGSTNELGIYRMEGNGLVSVENPSELLLANRDESLSGSATAVIVEGMRPLMVEVQALVSSAVYGTPQRSATGFDVRRLHMLLAVLEKRCGFKLGAKDVFLNIAGGIKVNDPSIDLAVVAAILSSSQDIPIEKGLCFAGEVGLSGEVRPVQRIDQRITESEKLGFKKFLVSSNQKSSSGMKGKIEVVGVARVPDILRLIFG